MIAARMDDLLNDGLLSGQRCRATISLSLSGPRLRCSFSFSAPPRLLARTEAHALIRIAVIYPSYALLLIISRSLRLLPARIFLNLDPL
jgi:hypothetical protein